MDKRTKLRQRQAEALRQQEKQEELRTNFGASREMFNKTAEEAKENRPEPEPQPLAKSSTLPWRNGEINGVDHKKTNGVEVPSTPVGKKTPEPLRIQPENHNHSQESSAVASAEEEEEEKKVKAPPPSFPMLFSPTENKTMDFPEPQVVVEKEKEPEKAPPPKAKVP